MKNIFHIYSADIHRIIRNWAAGVIITGLAILPSLYAWFNIEASWDPYGQTSGVSIAVANLDKGTTLRDQPINLGKEIVESLHQNEKLGWRFTEDSENAIQGVRHGDDYAAIIIPENFSARIGTVLSNEPVKAQILYYTNEKINAISPKVTAKGASGVVEEISKNFIKTANGTIFEIFNTLGIEIENQLPAINKVRNLLFRLEKAFRSSMKRWAQPQRILSWPTDWFSKLAPLCLALKKSPRTARLWPVRWRSSRMRPLVPRNRWSLLCVRTWRYWLQPPEHSRKCWTL